MARKTFPDSAGMDHLFRRGLDWAVSAPETATKQTPAQMIKLMRMQLGMTQAQLARRCGMPQSAVARFEGGRLDVQVGTLRRLLEAMECRLILAPLPRKGVADILRVQAEKAARKRVKRVAGTMALEKQRPDEHLLEDLVRAETEKLLRERRSEIWEE